MMAIKHAKFIKEIKQGKRLEVKELQKLNQQEWDDYKEQIMFKDKVYTEYVKNMIDKLRQTDDWAREMVEHIENQTDNFEAKFDIIDKRFMDMYEENFAKGATEANEFNLLTSQDCRHCRTGLFCKEHTYHRSLLQLLYKSKVY